MTQTTQPFVYTVVVREGQKRTPVGTVQTPEQLNYNNVLRLKIDGGLALYRISEISITETKAGIERTATVKALLEPTAVIITGQVVETSAPTEPAAA